MRKYVYLFELDSVRKTDDEIIIGQQALYDEITMNGNVVVMTYNQLVDSRGFFSLLNSEIYHKNLIQLFEQGMIRISQYGDIRTVSQYLLNSIDEDKKFIYSALPICYNQKRLTALMRRSLMYADLSEINDYIQIARELNADGAPDVRQRAKLLDLFVEIRDGHEHSTELSVKEIEIILENLYWLLQTVLRLSMMHDVYISPKKEEEYKELKLHNILAAVMQFRNVKDSLFLAAVEMIRQLPDLENDNRSVHLRELKERAIEESQVYRYAEAIINLCYNYACENSIRNISKHYNVSELLNPEVGMPTFQADFMARLAQDWRNGKDQEKRYLQDETNAFVPFSQFRRIPRLEEAVRLTEYTEYKNKGQENAEKIPRYEYDIKRQRKRHKGKIMGAIIKNGLFAILCILIACAIELLFNIGQDALDNYIHFDTVVLGIVETLVLLFVTEAITTGLSKVLPDVLSLSDALGGIGRLIYDTCQVIFRKPAAYMNQLCKDVEQTEAFSQGNPITCVCSKALKNYRRLAVKHGDEYFTPSDTYPIADVSDTSVLEQLLRVEEVQSCRFGLVYRSHYNMLLVDPIVEDNGKYFAYERILPTQRDGVVMLVKCKDRFILLEQFRHAIRRKQYACPRGFAEPNSSPVENVRRELQEELHAVIVGEPVPLGRICSDSGLTGGRAYVFYVEIEHYEEMAGNEGIQHVVTVTEEELRQRIQKGQIDDSYTLGAYALYCSDKWKIC